MIDNSPPGKFMKAFEAQQDRIARNAALIETNDTIKSMASRGASVAEIMTTTGKSEAYVRQIGGVNG